MAASSACAAIDRLVLPVRKSCLDSVTSARVGVDSGGLLHKIVFVTERDSEFYNLNFLLLPHKADGIEAGLRLVRDECKLLKMDGTDRLKVTGLGYRHECQFNAILNCHSEFVVEALCWIRGCHWAVENLDPRDLFYPHEQADACFCRSSSTAVLDKIQENLRIDCSSQRQFPAVIVHANSSVSMCIVDERGQALKMSICFFSCKTMLALARLLVGVGDYDELLALAARGDRGQLDLKVNELTASDPLNPFGSCNGDMPLMHLGKLADGLVETADAKPEDVARSLLSLFCFNLFSAVVSFATGAGVDSVLLVGNFFRGALVRKEFENAKAFVLNKSGFRHQFLKVGGQVGSIGALVAENGEAHTVLKFAV